MLVDLGDEAVGDLLDLIFESFHHIFRYAFRFFLDVFVGFAANRADAHFGVFAFRFCFLHQFLPAFFRQRRDVDPNHRSVIRRSEAEVGAQDRLFDRAQHALFPGLNHQCTGFRCAHVRDLVQGSRGTVVVNVHAVEHGRVGAAGADLGEFDFQVVDRLLHMRTGVVQGLVGV